MAEPEQQASRKSDPVYRCKTVSFLGRSVPIILQNDNGPCPLIAICNVLLLRNHISLPLGTSEVSLQDLLTLVAGRLLDANSNNEDKDENYIQNQQQNIEDAISLLPRLATGIDVNVRFRNIHDFEFTPECAIFDLLDISLVHGWLYDPQDENTSRAVGSNSYNVLVEKLVALQASKSDVPNEPTSDDDVDFAAATTASLGVPSPSLCSRNSAAQGPAFGQYDMQVDQMLEKLDLSGEEKACTDYQQGEVTSAVTECSTELETKAENEKTEDTDQASNRQASVSTDASMVSSWSEAQDPVVDGFVSVSRQVDPVQSSLPTLPSLTLWAPENDASNSLAGASSYPEAEQPVVLADGPGSSPTSLQKGSMSDFECVQADDSGGDGTSFEPTNTEQGAEGQKAMPTFAAESSSETGTSLAESAKSSQDLESAQKSFGEPLYEGEAQPLEDFEDREPLYEGEAILADAPGPSGLDVHSTEEGLIIENFLSSHASQLTYHGLFSLQEGLKDRELCVFFRNNHFSTMFKHNEDLFLLVTDQGYISEPNLVWEKLTEVDGDSVFFTGNFEAFKLDEPGSSSWNERDAVAATADYLTQMNTSGTQTDPRRSEYSSDLQLALALQQQEFEQQQPGNRQQEPQQQQQQPQPQTTSHSPSPRKARPAIGTGRLFTGGRSHSPPSPKQDTKSKDKCRVM